MRVACLALTAAVLLSGCDARAGVASIGSQDLPSGASYRVTGTVSVGNYANGVAVDPGTHTVYVANEGDSTVSVIDAATRTVTATIPVGESPSDVAVDPSTHSVYVSDVNGVTVIDGSTRTVTATIPVGQALGTVAVDPGTHTVYVEGEYVLLVIDGLTQTVTATVPLREKQEGHPIHRNDLAGQVALDTDTHTVYVGDVWRRGVTVIDGSTHTVTATVPLGGSPDNIAVDPGTHTVYVEGEHVLLVIDGLTQTVTATVPLREKQEGHPIYRNDLAGQVALDPSTHTVYVANSWANAVTVIDGSTHTVTATVPLGGSPDKIAVDSGSHTIYVTRGDVNNVTLKVGRAMSVIDGTTRTVTADIPTALWGSMAVDPDTHTVFAATGPNSSDNAVSVIGGTTGTVITTIPISYSAYGVAVDPESHIVYVTGLVPHHPYGAVSIIESVPG